MLYIITVIILTGPSRRLAEQIIRLGLNISMANCIAISDFLSNSEAIRFSTFEWDEGECLNWNSYIDQIWINYLPVPGK